MCGVRSGFVFSSCRCCSCGLNMRSSQLCSSSSSSDSWSVSMVLMSRSWSMSLYAMMSIVMGRFNGIASGMSQVGD